MTTTVSISRTDETVVLAAPWAVGLPAGAKRIGGRFSPADKSWIFALEDEARVRDLTVEIYGTDGTDSGATVSLRILNVGAFNDTYTSAAILGRTLAHRSSRDADVRLGRGVVIVEGAFYSSAGSIRNPQLGDGEGLVLEVRDVDAAAAAEAVRRYPDDVEIVDGAHVQRTLLLAERERLMTKLAELEDELKSSAR